METSPAQPSLVGPSYSNSLSSPAHFNTVGVAEEHSTTGAPGNSEKINLSFFTRVMVRVRVSVRVILWNYVLLIFELIRLHDSYELFVTDWGFDPIHGSMVMAASILDSLNWKPFYFFWKVLKSNSIQFCVYTCELWSRNLKKTRSMLQFSAPITADSSEAPRPIISAPNATKSLSSSNPRRLQLSRMRIILLAKTRVRESRKEPPREAPKNALRIGAASVGSAWGWRGSSAGVDRRFALCTDTPINITVCLITRVLRRMQ